MHVRSCRGENPGSKSGNLVSRRRQHKTQHLSLFLPGERIKSVLCVCLLCGGGSVSDPAVRRHQEHLNDYNLNTIPPKRTNTWFSGARAKTKTSVAGIIVRGRAYDHPNLNPVCKGSPVYTVRGVTSAHTMSYYRGVYRAMHAAMLSIRGQTTNRRLLLELKAPLSPRGNMA